MSESEVCTKPAGDCNEAKENLIESEKSATDCEKNNTEELIEPSACEVAEPPRDDNQCPKKDEPAAEEADNEESKKQQVDALRNVQKERDEYKKKLEEAERKVAELLASQSATSNGSSGDFQLELEELKSGLAQTRVSLEDRDRRIANQESQISALIKQVSSLKEVVAITKDMLNIRNMEVKHLQQDVDKMELKITAERERQSAMLNKMDAAVRLNADLKQEYQTQLRLFQDLRGKYEEKVTLLSEENKALETAIQAQPTQ